MSSSNYCLTCIQISQEAGQVVWYSHLLNNFPQFVVIHTVKGFDVVNKAEVDVFLEHCWFFNDPMDIGNLIFGTFVFPNPARTSGSPLFTYCWNLSWRILSITLLACKSESHLVVSDSLWPHRLYSPWNSPGQNIGVGSLSLFQGIFPTQGLNTGLPHCRQIPYQLSHKGSPRILEWVAYPFSRRYSQPRDRTGLSCIAGWFFTNWAIREASLWDEWNCVVVLAFIGTAFLWDWNKNWHFPVLWPLLHFPNLLAYWVQHFHSIIF